MSKPKVIPQKEFIKLLAKSSDYHEYEVKDILNSLAVVVAKALKDEQSVKIEGIGTFTQRKGIFRKFRSVIHDTYIEKVTKNKVDFKVDNYMSNALNPEELDLPFNPNN
jgi:nucleoid DNA-binding protein